MVQKEDRRRVGYCRQWAPLIYNYYLGMMTFSTRYFGLSVLFPQWATEKQLPGRSCFKLSLAMLRDHITDSSIIGRMMESTEPAFYHVGYEIKIEQTENLLSVHGNKTLGNLSPNPITSTTAQNKSMKTLAAR
jgi:hypothetical protein